MVRIKEQRNHLGVTVLLLLVLVTAGCVQKSQKGKAKATSTPAPRAKAARSAGTKAAEATGAKEAKVANEGTTSAAKGAEKTAERAMENELTLVFTKSDTGTVGAVEFETKKALKGQYMVKAPSGKTYPLLRKDEDLFLLQMPYATFKTLFGNGEYVVYLEDKSQAKKATGPAADPTKGKRPPPEDEVKVAKEPKPSQTEAKDNKPPEENKTTSKPEEKGKIKPVVKDSAKKPKERAVLQDKGKTALQRKGLLYENQWEISGEYPPLPEVLAPARDATAVSRKPTIKWKASKGARYHWVLIEDVHGKKEVLDKVFGPKVTSYQLTSDEELNGDREYRVTVEANMPSIHRRSAVSIRFTTGR